MTMKTATVIYVPGRASVQHAPSGPRPSTPKPGPRPPTRDVHDWLTAACSTVVVAWALAISFVPIFV